MSIAANILLIVLELIALYNAPQTTFYTRAKKYAEKSEQVSQ